MTFSGDSNQITSGGTNTLNAALTATNATFSGAENVDTTNINAGYTVSGTTTINGGKVNFASSTPAILGQTLVINDGHVTFAAAVTEVDQYIQTGGTLSGPGELRVSSTTLSGGSMLGPGKFIIDGSVGGQLVNQGTLGANGNNLVLNGPVTGSGAHVRPLSRRRRTDKR
ncbi:hypothetical protein [Methylomonas koyamae]|uniref:hypothetical protein n=1 Tax=Methylomonas koyamae TaxID=702114 RepID=UPI001125DD56|nr:hypothetical protein [Methylomonas koyamae]TPQ25832.1 hypothetical protein C2U68_14115 [Methylomonas koyamae]